jgi:hypothetical protein
MAGPAAGAKQDEFMKPAAMKLLLNNADSKPIPCAIGEGAEPIMMFEKIGKPKKLLATMLADAHKRKTPIPNDTARYGMATLDPADTSVIQVRVNKSVKPSMQMALRKTVKGIGFSEIVFIVDDKLEAADGDAEEKEGGEAQTAEIPVEPPRDAKTLTAELVRLVGQMKALSGVDPGYLQRLNGLAAAAGGAIKAPDLAQAEEHLKALGELLAQTPPPLPGTIGPGAAPAAETCAKSRDIWLATRKRVEDGISALRSAILDTYKDAGMSAQLEKAFDDRVGPVREALGDRLGTTLDQAAKTQDAAARGRLMADAQAIMKDYIAYVGSAPIVADLDNNPFISPAIQPTVTKTLEALSKVH